MPPKRGPDPDARVPLHQRFVCARDNATMPEMVDAVERLSCQLHLPERAVVLRMIVENTPPHVRAFERQAAGTLVNLSKISPTTLMNIYEYIVYQTENTP